MKKTVKVYPILLCAGLLLAHPSFADDNQEGWRQMKGQNFIIYYRADVPVDFAQTTMDTAEEEFKRVSDNLGITNNQNWSWENQAKVYIYSDRDDYVKNGRQAIWSHGAAFAQARTIKTYPDSQGFFDSILPHELGHIIFRDYIGFTAIVPLWFEEGVAIYQEKAKRLGANKTVKEAIENGQFIPLSQLSGVRLYKDSKDQVVDLFYTESASAVYYMITELGDQEFYMFCNELKNNTPFEEALLKVYLRFRTIDELNQAWVDFLQG
jgi:Peptidase MA superfamily